MDKLVGIVTWLGLLGIPSIFAIVSGLIRHLYGISKKQKILMAAVQAQMRGRLLDKYHEYVDQGFVDEDDLKQWESEYQAYHTLGENGIMTERRKKLIDLPNKPQVANL